MIPACRAQPPAPPRLAVRVFLFLAILVAALLAGYLTGPLGIPGVLLGAGRLLSQIGLIDR